MVVVAMAMVVEVVERPKIVGGGADRRITIIITECEELNAWTEC